MERYDHNSKQRNAARLVARQRPSLSRLPTVCALLCFSCWLATLMTSVLPAFAQDAPSASKPAAAESNDDELKVNWLYGSFVPKDVPFKPLTSEQRWKLYARMTYTTYGIYIKTAFFAMRDQVADSPPGWGQTGEGFAKRLGTRQAQFIIQNTLTAFGDGVADWEIRYERCRCDGFWPRTWHAAKRNFVTYGGRDQSLRPQLMPYAASFAAGATSASWAPNHPSLVVKGYQAAITQVGVGIGVNWLAEFAPEIQRTLHLEKKKATPGQGP
jgi:hypothetical protein